ncbi:ABC-2 type transport system ATP-binding protein [Actinoplanes campanulatus]|uniref:ABC-2 type transport system ATP-binding protein n=1 Tax=Actinoplanes campanulatus TaxID=113559 RepID=A0A7W5ANW1_9ACTN|nr:ABC transporter ATP-binding protein [Actinoplanes campanulatus]MBB3099736.1 ABC-2 type transport system ATP-binding protein [Actinoplanes campanulatus]GGN25444.1 ABC transporter ATP-binding protein [Actinoplanes campanulatus]GID39418.1 ABC transporter ATP-binding protein [Actinoplanes campanulatus]
MTTVTVQGVSKHYGSLTALDGVDLEIGVGVTGLLGPNGAGKSTLLRCLATALGPDSGSIRVRGLDPAVPAQRTEVRRRIGYLPQNPGLYPNFTAYDLLDYVAVLKEVTDTRQRRAEVRRVLDEVELTDRAKTKVRKLSGGMRQRLGLAQALLGDPELLILDEPTVGLDPEQRMLFRALISRIGECRTVLLSTHQTEDVGALCERVVVMSGGRVVFEGSPRELAGVADGQVWLSESPPQGNTAYWRNADGLYRTVGQQPDGAEATRPSIEDGYLMLLGRAAIAEVVR